MFGHAAVAYFRAPPDKEGCFGIIRPLSCLPGLQFIDAVVHQGMYAEDEKEPAVLLLF